MTQKLTIRRAKPEDRPRIATLLARCYKSGGAQAIADVSKLREAAPNAIEYLGSAGDKPDGYIMLTPLPLADEQVALISYIALNPQAPEFFNPQEFIEQVSSSVAKDACAIVVFGQAQDFAAVGFKPAAELGLTIKNPPAEGEALARPLHDHAPAGEIDLPPALLRI